jgi:hypothetical protein
MSPVVILTVTLKLIVFWLLKIIKHLYDICTEFLLYWKFSNYIAFRK